MKIYTASQRRLMAEASQQHLDALVAAALDRYHRTPAWQLELAARKAQALRA